MTKTEISPAKSTNDNLPTVVTAREQGTERNRKESKGDRGRSVYVSRSTTNVKRTVRGEVGHFEHDPHDQMRTGRFTVHQCTGRLTSGGTVFNGRHQIIRVFAQTFNGSFHPYLNQPHQWHPSHQPQHEHWKKVSIDRLRRVIFRRCIQT